MKSKINKEHCPHCLQPTSYDLALDKGTAELMMALSDFIGRKGINIVHPRKEMESQGILSSNQVGNLSHARFHGLVAKIKGNAGNYCITAKGFGFLRGDQVGRIAIIKKVTINEPAHNAGYREVWTSIDQLVNGAGAYWAGCGYDVREGVVVKRLEKLPGI